MSYKVKVMLAGEAPEEISKYFVYPEGRSVLIMYHNGEMIDWHVDGGEPKDNYFFRDWSWIETALEDAYERGLEDGQKTTTNGR